MESAKANAQNKVTLFMNFSPVKKGGGESGLMVWRKSPFFIVILIVVRILYNTLKKKQMKVSKYLAFKPPR
jgi:hypothetical protein